MSFMFFFFNYYCQTVFQTVINKQILLYKLQSKAKCMDLLHVKPAIDSLDCTATVFRFIFKMVGFSKQITK